MDAARTDGHTCLRDDLLNIEFTILYPLQGHRDLPSRVRQPISLRRTGEVEKPVPHVVDVCPAGPHVQHGCINVAKGERAYQEAFYFSPSYRRAPA
jgi:hypothetical protein